MSRAAHIVTTGFAPWDAISNHVLQEQRVLRGLGIRCEIFADMRFVHEDLRSLVHPASSWERVARPDDVALLHYSIASESIDHVLARAERSAIGYHNITPAELLWEWAPGLARVCAVGRRRLAELAQRVTASSADSDYNAGELRELGFPNPAVVGILRPPLPPPISAARHRSDRLEVLFVGRGVPNKAIHHLAMTMHALKDVGVRAHLTHIGSWGGMAPYERYCRDLIHELDLHHEITLLGSVSDARMASAYANADVFLCLSDHEGFCVPIVEAMHYGLPIVAFASSAVPWTAGDAALLLDEKSPSLVSEAIQEVRENTALRERMAAGRERQLAYHSETSVTGRLLAHLEDLL